MAKYKRAVIPMTYQDRNGEDKKRWIDAGIMTKDGKGNIVVALNPWINLAGLVEEGSDKVWVKFFDPDEDRDNGGSRGYRDRDDGRGHRGGGSRGGSRGRTDGYEDARNSNPAGGEHFDDDIPF